MKKLKQIFMFALILAMNLSYANPQQLEQNKQITIKFYNLAINQKDFESASHYLGANYKQHNPTAQDGIIGLQQFIHYLRDNYPDSHSEIKKIFAEGDYVMLHVHSIRMPATPGRAVFDLFKLKDGKIIEHWDVIQDIPVKTVNSNGMF